jgi:hypothetical protein
MSEGRRYPYLLPEPALRGLFAESGALQRYIAAPTAPGDWRARVALK